MSHILIYRNDGKVSHFSIYLHFWEVSRQLRSWGRGGELFSYIILPLPTISRSFAFQGSNLLRTATAQTCPETNKIDQCSRWQTQILPHLAVENFDCSEKWTYLQGWGRDRDVEDGLIETAGDEKWNKIGRWGLTCIHNLCKIAS